VAKWEWRGSKCSWFVLRRFQYSPVGIGKDYEEPEPGSLASRPKVESEVSQIRSANHRAVILLHFRLILGFAK
jgi:hypothetical protein